MRADAAIRVTAWVGLAALLVGAAWWFLVRGVPSEGPSADPGQPVAAVAGKGPSGSIDGGAQAVSTASALRYLGSQACERCHADQFKLWNGSDHQRAMAAAAPETVRADFKDRQFKHFQVTSRMTRRDGRFFVETDNRQGKLESFPVKYTFGYRPLQQYLVEFPDGRVQCLPLAWDTERNRWFHLYPNEPIPHDDVLHWTRPLQNWNYMCAECHTTDLKKNFDLAENRYHTTFQEMGVGCESCHGPGSRHVELADSWRKFVGQSDYALPKFKGVDSRVEIETCAPCHSRRRIVAPDFRPGNPYLDHYMVELLDTELFYADGQIRDEDFEYTSFLQSRMYHEKVRCSNCHDPHSIRVKFPDNRLCGQCHVPAKYDTPAHHHHPDSTKAGTRCVECHMPETTYMVVDPRRDHSIRIPRPDLTVGLGIPNACNGCHHDEAKGETPRWAVKQVETWYGVRKGPPHFAYAIDAGRKGVPEAERQLESVVQRRETRAIVRASAILLLARYRSETARSAALEGLDDAEGLVRVAAVRALEFVAPQEIRMPLVARLRDPLRAVRTEAARLLSRLPGHSFTAADQKAFQAALEEYLAGQAAVNDQPAAHLNVGAVQANLGRMGLAKQSYETALRLDAGFVPARINLAMLYDSAGQKAEAEAQFRRALETDPKLAEAHYSLGLLLAEDPKRLDEAAESLGRAVKLSPQNARMHYNYGLALQRLERVAEAEAALGEATRLDPDNPDFLNALAIFHVQQKRWPAAAAAAEALLRVAPGNPQAAQLLDHIRRSAAEK